MKTARDFMMERCKWNLGFETLPTVTKLSNLRVDAAQALNASTRRDKEFYENWNSYNSLKIFWEVMYSSSKMNTVRGNFSFWSREIRIIEEEIDNLEESDLKFLDILRNNLEMAHLVSGYYTELMFKGASEPLTDEDLSETEA